MKNDFFTLNFFAFLFSISFTNIYFPTNYENYTYVSMNQELNPLAYFSWYMDEKRIVQFFINDSIIYGAVSFSKNYEDTCYLFRTNISNFDRRCIIGNSIGSINRNLTILTLNCMKFSYVILIKHFHNCVNYYDLKILIHEGKNPNSIFYPILMVRNIKQSQSISMSFSKNETYFILLIWIKDNSKIGILKILDRKNVDFNSVKNLKFLWKDLHEHFNINLIRIIDIKINFEFCFFSLNDGCVYWCLSFNCNKMNLIQVWKCMSKVESKFGTLTVSGSGKVILHVESLSEGLPAKQGTNAISTYRVNYNVIKAFTHNKELYWKQCGSITLSDLVFLHSNTYDYLNDQNPCKLDHDGTLLSCLILGEPYIFDIHDCNSAHPVSTFSTSSLRQGYTINRYSFLQENLFFYETISEMELDKIPVSLGFIFDIKAELQPTLIASQIIYPTLVTALSPGESFIIVNHKNEELFLFTPSGRIFSSRPIKNKFEIQLFYRTDLSFYISDTLRMSNTSNFKSIPISHNFEHPFAFFSPKFLKLVYFSFYQSDSGSFSASAVTVSSIDMPKSQSKSIIQIGGETILIQCGIDQTEKILIIVYKSVVKNFFDVKITFLEKMPVYSFGTEFVISQNEVPGSWLILIGNQKESARIWTIPFNKNNSFFLASHNFENSTTSISNYVLNNDMTILKISSIELNECFVVTNINDYNKMMSVVLCLQNNASNHDEIYFKILLFDFSKTFRLICEHKIYKKFINYNNWFEGETISRFPLFYFDHVSQRIVIAIEDWVYTFSYLTCPFTKLFDYKNSHIISSVALYTITLRKKYFSITLLSYLQKLDAISDCTNGYGLVDEFKSIKIFCVRCSPGEFGLGCQLCTPGFYCQGYSQLQPTGPCPEGYYCLEGTSIVIDRSKEDSYLSLLNAPNLCPPGSYCPAGTATFLEDDLTHNNPKPCLEGYYCPEGSSKPTQKSCPKNAISSQGASSLNECKCKIGFYGDTIETGLCIPCLNDANCSSQTQNNSIIRYLMNIPIGYWPNTPENVTEILKCDVSITGKTPCIGGSCFLYCQNNQNLINSTIQNLSCITNCTNVCMKGQGERMCSKCNEFYFRHSSSICKSCHLTIQQYTILGIMSLICIASLLWYFIRKYLKNELKQNISDEKYIKPNNFIISDEAILEIVLTITLLLAGASSTSTLFLIFFATFVTYIQQLDSPPYTKNIFIFYVQTLQALTSDKFIWPRYMTIIFTFFDVIYSPFPSISCLPNIFTGKDLGWHGNFFLFLSLPIISAIGLIIGLWIAFKAKNKFYVQPIYSYLMLMSVLQFPLGSLSLSTLACSYDSVSNFYYMTSEPWVRCKIISSVQISGLIGTFLYFLGIPFLLHYWYWKSSFLSSVKTRIGDLILPAGCREDSFFLIFATLRGILLALVVSAFPPEWKISSVIIFILLGFNIIIVLTRKPYLEYNSKKEKSKTISGEMLEVSSIFMILTSMFLLDAKSKFLNISTKSHIVGTLNFLYSLYFLFGVIFSERIRNSKIFQKLLDFRCKLSF